MSIVSASSRTPNPEPRTPSRRSPLRRNGLSRTEVVVILGVVGGACVMGCVVVGLLAAILVPSFANARGTADMIKDGAQQRGIHQSWLVFSRDVNGSVPTPGLVDSLPVDLDGDGRPDEDAPGIGPVDHQLNHSAPLYSMMIAQNLFGPEICVSPGEVQPYVVVKSDYNWDAYDPLGDVYWDSTFLMDVHDPTSQANASYAHVTLIGDRIGADRANSVTSMPAFGTRGTRGGVTSGPEHDRSPTLRLLGDGRTWVGNVCFMDNSVKVVAGAFTVPGLLYDDGSGPRLDNMYDAEFKRGQMEADAFLSISVSASENAVEDVYDPLE